MAVGIERYNSASGGTVVEGWPRTVGVISEDAAVPPWNPGSGNGAGVDRFVASLDGFRTEVNARLDEQGRVGDLIAEMLQGVHKRLGEDDGFFRDGPR